MWTENILKTELSEDDDVTIIRLYLSARVFLKHKSKMAAEMVIAMRMLTGTLKRFRRLCILVPRARSIPAAGHKDRGSGDENAACGPACAISFPEVRSPWLEKRELWEQPFQACAIACKTACHRCRLRLCSEPDNQNSVISLCYFKLYNNLSYPRLLIGSRLWSIRGQMHDWRHHYKDFPSVF